MMIGTRMHLKFIASFVLLCWTGSVVAQETSRDQVGLVVPAFVSDSPLSESVAFLLSLLVKFGVQGELSSEDPTTMERGFGRGLVYFVPAQLRSPSHEQAASLARLNGLQGTIWGYATDLSGGVAIQTFFSISPTYEDFRATRNELWRWGEDKFALILGPPQENVAFRSETLTEDLVATFAPPSEIDFCPVDGGRCVRFSDPLEGRVTARTDTGAVVRRDRVEYIVRFPDSDLLRSEVIDYAGIFIAYARGNLNQVIQFADRYLERHGPSDAAIDVHLYRAAARARLGQVEAARGDIDAALELNPVSRRSLRYGIMVELVADGKPNERSESYFQMLDRTYGLSSEFDRRYASLDR